MKHLTPKGWKPCKANKRPCQYQQDSFVVAPELKVYGRYLAAPVEEKQIRSYLEKLYEVSPNAKELEEAKALRDRGREFHITLLTPKETRLLRKKGELPLPPKINFTPIGLGRVKEEGREAWFVVVESPEAQKYRESLGLPPSDLHITIGFKERDINGVYKGKETLI